MAQSFIVRIRFEIKRTAPPVRVGVGFTTLDGVRIATLHHTDCGQGAFSGPPGAYEVSVRLMNPLLPGTYAISVGAHSTLGGTALDYVPGALRFTVLDIAAGDAVFEQHNFGLVRFDAQWSAPRQVQESASWELTGSVQ
jgi:hypothetical protein